MSFINSDNELRPNKKSDWDNVRDKRIVFKTLPCSARHSGTTLSSQHPKAEAEGL
jgi:hypothetical protein